MKWNKLELWPQSKNVYHKSCQACHESKVGWKYFQKHQKNQIEMELKDINWNYSSKSKNVFKKVCHESKIGLKCFPK